MVREARSAGWRGGRSRSARAEAGGVKTAMARAPHRLAVSAAAALVLSLALVLWAASVSAAALGPFVQQAPKIQGEQSSFDGPESTSGFGHDVAISAYLGTAVVGTAFGFAAGVVYTQTGSTWSQQAVLNFTGGWPLKVPGQGTRAGESVAISADGNTVLLGGPNNECGVGAGVGVHALGLHMDPAGNPRTERAK